MKQITTTQQVLWSVLLAGALGVANAAEFTVDQAFDGVDVNPGDGTCATANGSCTLRAAVMETNALAGADIISIPAGTYSLVLGNTGEDLAAEGDLDILDDLTIVGADPATTILTGNVNQFRVFSVLKRTGFGLPLPIVSISNVTLTEGVIGGIGMLGAVLYNEGELTLDNVTVDNASEDKAAIYNKAGSLSVKSSRIHNNYAGIQSQSGILNIDNSSFFSNGTSGLGSAISGGSLLIIDNSQFNGNTSDLSGGAVYSPGILIIRNSSFDSNSVTGRDGAGGALWFTNGIIVDTSITNNTASEYGGGIFSTVATLKRVTLTGNQATNQNGGAAYISALADISDSIITGNSAGNAGGGLVLGPLNFVGNPILVRHTEISGNSAPYAGGLLTKSNNIKLENLTISDNSASVNGGGLYHSANTTNSVQLTHVTLAANTAPTGMGGNIANASGVVRLSNTLVAASGGGLNCSGTITSLGYNLDSSNSCGLNKTGDQTSVDSLLNVLADNGGNSKTHALLTGSPAIDAGNSVLCISRNGLDQRYFYRGDGACDVGAYEADSTRAQSGTLAFSLANFSVNETDGTGTVTVSRTGGSEGGVSIRYSDLNTGTAKAGTYDDYTAIDSAILQWMDGDAADKTIDITIRDNSFIDGDKTINLTLGSTTDGGAAIGTQNTTTVTIVDDESIPGSVTFDDAIYTVAENGSYLDITVNRLDGNAPVSIDYATSDISAIAGTDYVAASGTLDFALRETSGTIRVQVTDNSIYEGDKTFSITLSNPQGGVAFGQWSSSVVTIQDDEAQPSPSTIAFDVSSVNISEAGASVTLNLTRTGSTTAEVSVSYATTDGTAVAESDYTASTGTITFDANVTSRSITLYITDDAITEGTESFAVSLSNPLGGASLGAIQAMTVNIQDDDTGGGVAGELQFGGGMFVNEADGTATVTVSRVNGSTGSINVNYTTNVDTLTSPATIGSDYNLTAGILTFADGVISQTITFSIIDDTLVEGDEDFRIELENATGGATISATGGLIQVTITDNDTATGANPGVIAVEAALYSSSENNNTVIYTLTRTGGTDGIVSVLVTFEDGSAEFGADYNASSQSYTATFQDGESRITGTVSIIDDSTIEPEETFGLRLSNPQGGATLGTVTVATITIADNDNSGNNNSENGGGGSMSPLLLLGGLLLAPVMRMRRRKQNNSIY